MVLVCIYRSPESDFNNFLAKLETVISRIQERKRDPSFVEIGMLIFFIAIKNYINYKTYWECII
jgi:hypothetical protein